MWAPVKGGHHSPYMHHQQYRILANMVNKNYRNYRKYRKKESKNTWTVYSTIYCKAFFGNNTKQLCKGEVGNLCLCKCLWVKKKMPIEILWTVISGPKPKTMMWVFEMSQKPGAATTVWEASTTHMQKSLHWNSKAQRSLWMCGDGCPLFKDTSYTKSKLFPPLATLALRTSPLLKTQRYPAILWDFSYHPETWWP